MPNELLVATAGGLIGGTLGVIGGLVTAYFAPRKLEEWREQRNEIKYSEPRKKLMKKMLSDETWPDGRRLETLSRVTGTPPDECRRLLIEIEARGVTLHGNVEGWALIARKPLDEE